MGTKILGIAIILVGVALFGWFVYALWQADVRFQSGVLAVIGVTTAALIAHQSANKREVNARHFSEKRQAYVQFADMVYDLMMSTKTGKRPPNDQQLMKKIIEFKKMLMLWADSDLILAWQKIEDHADDKDLGNDPHKAVLMWDDLLRALRKDLGKNDWRLARGRLAATVLNVEGRKEVMSKGKGK